MESGRKKIADLPPTASRSFGISGLSCAPAGVSSAIATAATIGGKSWPIVAFSLTRCRSFVGRSTPVIAPFAPYLKAMRPEDILVRTPAGVCCKIGGFHIDPARPADKAVITHGHSDHARAGHGAVLGTQETLDLMRLRYGDGFARSTQAIRYGESITIDGVAVRFHPAGHVLGSAQIAVAANGLRVVASGDYKNVVDPT